LIEVEGLAKSIKGRVLFRDLTFRVEGGRILGVIGPNGSGKSLLLATIAGITRPDAGSVLICGIDPFRRWGDVLKLMGYQPQNELSPEAMELTPLEYLRYLLSRCGVKRRERKELASAALKLFDLDGLERVRIGELSVGQRAKLRIAGAIAHNPQVVIFDEPLAPLDPKGREELKRILLELRSMGKSIVIASNLVDDLEAISDETLEMGG